MTNTNQSTQDQLEQKTPVETNDIVSNEQVESTPEEAVSENLKPAVEAALFAANQPLSVKEIAKLFAKEERPEVKTLRAVIGELQSDYENRGIEILEVASGFRVQVRSDYNEIVTKLWEQRPPRMSRALLETLALVAYKQPVTRGDIEDVRGVAVSTHITRTLLDRGWIKEVGHKDVPGKPALFGTTPEFLNYFGLKKLEDLPELSDASELAPMTGELDLLMAAAEQASASTETSTDADSAVSEEENSGESNVVPLHSASVANEDSLDGDGDAAEGVVDEAEVTEESEISGADNEAAEKRSVN